MPRAITFFIGIFVGLLLLQPTLAMSDTVSLTLENQSDSPITGFWLKPSNLSGNVWKEFKPDGGGDTIAPMNGNGRINYTPEENDTANCSNDTRIKFLTGEFLNIDKVDLCAIDRITITTNTDQILYQAHRIGDTSHNSVFENDRRVHLQRVAEIHRVLRPFGFWGTLSTDCTAKPDDGNAIQIDVPDGDYYKDWIKITAKSRHDYTVTNAAVQANDANKIRISFGVRTNGHRIYTAFLVRDENTFRFTDMIVTSTGTDHSHVKTSVIKDSRIEAYSQPPNIVGDSDWLRVGDEAPTFHSCLSEWKTAQSKDVSDDPEFINACKDEVLGLWEAEFHDYPSRKWTETKLVYAWPLVQKQRADKRWGVVFANIYADKRSYDLFATICQSKTRVGSDLQYHHLGGDSGLLLYYVGEELGERVDTQRLCNIAQQQLAPMKLREGNLGCR